MGTVHSDINDLKPVLISTSPQPYVVENFFAWTDYSDDYTESAEPPTQYFGNVKTLYYISQKNETSWF